MNIGIYGGSFNPLHYGHLGIATRAIAELSLDRLIVVPAATNPFKAGENVEAESELFDRLARIEAAFAELPQAVIDRRELERGGISYAIDTVREIAAENPGAKLHFIIGEDCVEGLPRWKDIDELKRLCTFGVFPRTRESSTEIRRLFTAAKVVENPDSAIAATVRKGVLRKHGYCPCRLPKLPEFFCPCDEFKAQLADPNFHGLCHCRLYLKP